MHAGTSMDLRESKMPAYHKHFGISKVTIEQTRTLIQPHDHFQTQTHTHNQTQIRTETETQTHSRTRKHAITTSNSYSKLIS
ncbi:unnamed protein product, partial [Nesidiocoris tenuis]